MGEGNEAIPAALIRDAGVKLTDRKIRENEMAISYDQCVYVRGLVTRILCNYSFNRAESDRKLW